MLTGRRNAWALVIPGSLLCACVPREAADAQAGTRTGVHPAWGSLRNAVAFENRFVRFRLSPENGCYEIVDRETGAAWHSIPRLPRFGEATITLGGKRRRMDLRRCEVRRLDDGIEAAFRPLDAPGAELRVRVRALPDGRTLEFSCDADDALAVESVRLLDDALWVTDAEEGYVLVPARLGLLVPADSGKEFTHRFDTFAYEGCHMEMLGVVKKGAAALLTWHDPYVAAELRSEISRAGRQALSPSLVLGGSARSFRLRLVGEGDCAAIAKAYREVAGEKGWLVKWAEKTRTNPQRAKLFGAINFKLWSTLTRRMNEESTKEERLSVNWTFDEAARVAEHLKNDLGLERVLFILGGWIRRGYDNQHPDILPAAPECGGNDALADCARRVRALGYLFCLHDNYQDMYRDSPSWDEGFLMKRPDGSLARGGRWAGGRAYLTCSEKAVELAKRPQNLPAVKRLTGADAYFIDTTYAAGLQECFDPAHPLTRAGDMKWKQAISDYARGVFGIFGSECGREWAVPHSDFFEGLTGVSGRHYHDEKLREKLGAAVLPLFEMVYRDCIAMYGKYGYDYSQAAEYVLHHVSIARPLNYHGIPPHLYWKRPGAESLQLRPAVAELKRQSPREFSIAYRWDVAEPPAAYWRVFVHFTDAEGSIKFQNDHDPVPPTSEWRPGTVRQGPFTVRVPDGLTGEFDVRIGLWRPEGGGRALLLGWRDGQRRCILGKLRVSAGAIEFERAEEPQPPAGDPGLFTRADGGWAEGMHPLDRFVKNTYEILSPLHELTAEMQLTQHEFLTPDRKVRRTVFGEGEDAVEVVVNASAREVRYRTREGRGVTLAPYGFVVDSSVFAAFCALRWNGLAYDAPSLFTLRSMDGHPFDESGKVRVYHGFGDARVRVGGAVREVRREAVISMQ